MFRCFVCALLAGFVFAAVAPSQAVAQKKKMEVTMKWSGSVEDEKVLKPECITTR